MKVPVVREILRANDAVAVANRATFEGAGVAVLNVMGSPGAGKTSVILATVAGLGSAVRPGVIEGDIASTIDAELIASHGIPVVQINTGGNCHLDAPMVGAAVEHLDLAALDLLFIENVGNLICPANYRLGADVAVVIASVPEGHDKPYKYPGIFAGADVVLLNKTDVEEIFGFDRAVFEAGVRMVNPDAPVFPVSCRTGAGVAAWAAWLRARLAAGADAGLAPAAARG
jgi:hydrogenase nickel incorporation protein HypB